MQEGRAVCDDCGGVWGGLLLGPGAEGLRVRTDPSVCVCDECVCDGRGVVARGRFGECERPELLLGPGAEGLRVRTDPSVCVRVMSVCV